MNGYSHTTRMTAEEMWTETGEPSPALLSAVYMNGAAGFEEPGFTARSAATRNMVGTMYWFGAWVAQTDKIYEADSFSGVNRGRAWREEAAALKEQLEWGEQAARNPEVCEEFGKRLVQLKGNLLRNDHERSFESDLGKVVTMPARPRILAMDAVAQRGA